MRVMVAGPETLATALRPAEEHGARIVPVTDIAEALKEVNGREVVVVVASADSDVSPFAALPSGRRRRLVVVLVGPDFETGDWLAAFVRSVNLTVSQTDLPRLPQLVLAAAARQRELALLVESEATQ